MMARNAFGALCMCLLIPACGENPDQIQAREQTGQKAAVALEDAKRAEEIKGLVKQYGADPNWADDLQKGALTTSILRKSLIRTNGRPIMVRGLLIDIAPQGNSHKITFRTSDAPKFSVNGQHLLFEVTCSLSPTEINALRPSPYRLVFAPPDILVVTNVSDVLSAHSIIGERGADSSSATIQSVFTALGDCVLVKPDRMVPKD